MARKKTAPKQPDPSDLFPPIGQEGDIDIGGGSSNAPDLGAQLKALQETVGKLTSSLADGAKREERLQNLVTQLAVGRPQHQQQPPQQAQPVTIDWSKLPDPAKEPDAFKAKIAELVPQAVNSAVSAQISTRVQPELDAAKQRQRLEDLRKRFYDKNEDLKEYDDIMDAVAARLVREGQASGLTPEQVVFGADNGEGFIERVATNLRSRIKAITGDDGEGDDGEPGEGDGGTVEDKAGRQIPRTLGIAGGSDTLPTMPGSQNGNRNKPSDMVSELKAEQSRLKIY